jgi:hypothetical protein
MATGDTSYIPGAWTAVVGDHCLALVETPPDSPAVTRIWQRLGQGAPADALLASLVADGLDGTAGFTLLVAGTGGQYRLFCRGTLGATVVRGTAEGGSPPGGGPVTAERIDGAGLLTWREQVVDGADRIFLGEPPADTALRLPATSGVLLAGCVIIDLTSAASRETVADEWGTPKKSIVFFPETLTMTHPGSLADLVAAPVAPAAQLAPAMPVAPPAPAPPAPPATPPAPAMPVTGRPAGPFGGPPPTMVDGPGRPPAQSWQPLPDGAWSGGQRPGAPPSGPMVPPAPVTAPMRIRPQNPPGGMPGGGMPAGPVGGLIDAPPWLSGPSEPAPAMAPAPAIAVAPESTVKRGDLAEPAAMTVPPDRIGPVVPALICPNGHVNPPSGAICRRCGAPLPHDPVPVPRPVLGVLRLSFGDVIMLDRGVLMGRNPRTDFAGTDGEERPHVVKLPSAGGDISRTHLRVTLDGWHVLVTDLNSTNGTLITLPGRDPQQVRPGEPVPIQPGTVVTLAEGIDFRYEVTE